jgi:hypothetical protein
MDSLLNIKPATPEIVWAMLQELTEKQAETDRIVKENARLIKETGLQMQETDRIVKENARLMQETDRKMQETDRQIKETGLQMKETDRKMQETDRKMQETDRQMKETDRKIKETTRQLGGMAYNQGCFAEEYFINTFEKGHQYFFGEKFDSIRMNEKSGLNAVIEDEYDILLINGKTVGIVEIKFKAHINDIPEVLKKVDTFRANYPNYTNHKIYLGLATMAFYPELEQECIKQGIAIIKQSGEHLIIKDKHLKTF